VAKLQAITMPETDLAHLQQLGLDDDFDLEQLVGVELLGGAGGAVELHKARPGQITMDGDGAADRGDDDGDDGEFGDVEQRRGEKRLRGSERAAQLADEGGFPDAFGTELGQSPEALRAGTPMRTADRVGDIFGAGDDGFGGDGGFGDVFGDDGGFGDGAPIAAIGDADVPALGKTPATDRRESRLLASAMLGADARELVALSPEAFAVPESAPGTKTALPLATPGVDAAAAADALADITPAAAAAAQQAAKKRKYAVRDKTTELTSPAIKAQLNDTEPIVAKPPPVPRSKRAMQRAMRAEREPEQHLRVAPMRGLCAELAAMYAQSVDVAGSAEGDSDMRPLDAFGAELLDVPGVGGAGVAGERDDFDFGGGFDGGYGGDDFGAPGDFGGDNGGGGGPSTQQLLDGDDDGAAAARGDATALPPVNDDYYASDGEGEVVGTAFEGAASGASGAAAADDADAAAATPGKSTSWSQHTQRMHTFLARNFDAQAGVTELSFATMANDKARKVVAATFFELLVLKSKSYVELHQDKPYADILVAKGKNFDRPQK
jgi:hypothetical protein